MKKIKTLLFHRSVLVGFALLVQILILAIVILFFSEHTEVFYWGCICVSVLATLWILTRDMEPGYKIAWLILILPLPVFGGIFYLLVGGNGVSRYARHILQGVDQRCKETLISDFQAEELLSRDQDAAGQARYLENYAFCPVYTNTETSYYSLGDLAHPRILEELEKAEKYIFLEFFIIQEGEFWDSILEILKRKADQGVDVRLLYDDFGCMYTLPKHYDRQMEELGIRCRVYGRLVPVMSIRQNNRDHRKLLIVDGKVGMTGGINLSDEYINKKERFGHWKDSAIFLRGEGVWSMTVMFLSMWDHCSGWREDYDRFRPAPSGKKPGCGWVQPYTDSPLDKETVGRTVYLNMFARARKTIYITTPYLIIDESINTALCNAAKAGVDVRIITPHIPDKRYVFEVTRAHYHPLMAAGVRIYEYTPGFIHAKNCVVDATYATVGTVNLDYRSLFLHFEDGVWMYDTPCIQEIQSDFLETLTKSQEITPRYFRRHVTIIRHLYRAVLRVFAPLM